MSKDGKETVQADDAIVAASEVRLVEARVRELECLLAKTLEVEVLREALELARARK